MQERIIDSVNIFQGTRGSTKPQEGTLYSKWNLLKGKAGNTSPSACLPFGNVACSPYSGGYSSGYGNFMLNYGEEPKTFFDGGKLIGFSHFTHSGSGAFGFYYNYLVTVPFRNNITDIHTLKNIDEEKASVGYYACRFVEDNIRSEVTIADKVAIHRYTALDNKPLKIAIDISNDGLKQQPWGESVFAYAQESEMRVENDSVVGYVVMQGVKLYYCIAGTSSPSLWLDKKPIFERKLQLGKTEKSFGCVFEVGNPTATLKIGFSLVSIENAKTSVLFSPNFDEAKRQAENEWEKRFSTIQLDAFFAFSDDNALEDRFEGFNNETDMETPYFYHYVGRYDRIARIMKECTRSCFQSGENGLPGNNDSGGLSACYIWNFLGLFPISGQDKMFLGVPKAKKAILRFSNGNTLTILSEVTNGQTQKFSFNGKLVENYQISVKELLSGGELRFF